MPIHFCPNCNQRYIVGFDVVDFVHECNSGNLAIDEEDVVKSGDWEDYSGSGTVNKQEVMTQGAANQLQGTRAGVEGDDKDEITRRGAHAETHRQRPHLEFINLKKE